MLEVIGSALWFILPAYVANATPVMAGGGRPLDRGRKLSDGEPIFGSGKTVRGLLAGIVAGSVVAIVQGILTNSCKWPLVGLLLALGALVGDLIGSFIKRRLHIPRGRPAPLLDQLDFLLVALLFASPLMIPSWQEIATLLIITPLIHLGTNAGAYALGLKKHPW